jgi:hypothetical protein
MSSNAALTTARIGDLGAIAAADWDALTAGNPLLSHAFLRALETTGCVGPGTAWEPCHLIVRDEHAALVGAMPLYLKTDSRGEFVFDWSWADAYERAGLHYYPKLVSAVPFTPATGARLLVAADSDRATVTRLLIEEALAFAQDAGLSSWHVLFPSDSERGDYAAYGLLERKSCQFHWRNPGYADFDDFLARFSSAKRKKAKRERRRIAEAGIHFEHLPGDAVTRTDWEAIYEFYARTFLRRGRAPYLSRAFFDEIAATAPQHLLVVLARHETSPIATAICFQGGGALYGRYWGSVADFHSLHFETCYYQGIEYCIRHRLTKFEPGTQGEHKISRGFTPTATWSFHWLAEPAFYDAIQDYLEREASHVDSYMAHWDEHVPYRAGALGDHR